MKRLHLRGLVMELQRAMVQSHSSKAACAGFAATGFRVALPPPRLQRGSARVQSWDCVILPPRFSRQCCTVTRAAQSDNHPEDTVAAAVPAAGAHPDSAGAANTVLSGSNGVENYNSNNNNNAVEQLESSSAVGSPSVVSSSERQSDTAAEAAETAQLTGSLSSVWTGFLQQLWERGYFSDRQSADRDAAFSNKRDVKKALQQLGRSRPDLILLMPPWLFKQFAAVPVPVEQPGFLGRKAASAVLRITQAAAAADGTGKASTQDMLRVAWIVCSEQDDVETGEVVDTIRNVLQQILQQEQQPPQADLLAAAAAAAATPDMLRLQKHHASESRDGGKSRDRREGKDSERWTSRDGRKDAVPEEHKLRVLKASPYRQLRRFDWFCGQCGTHNFQTNETCFRCNVPSNSLGNSQVTLMEQKQLHQLGLWGVEPEDRVWAAEFAGQVADAWRENARANPRFSLIDAAKAAGLKKFKAGQGTAPAGGDNADRVARLDRGPHSRSMGERQGAVRGSREAASSSSREGRLHGSGRESRRDSRGQHRDGDSSDDDDDAQDIIDSTSTADIEAAIAAVAARRKVQQQRRKLQDTTLQASSSSSSSAGSLANLVRSAFDTDTGIAKQQRVPPAETQQSQGDVSDAIDATSDTSRATRSTYGRQRLFGAAAGLDSPAAAAAVEWTSSRRTAAASGSRPGREWQEQDNAGNTDDAGEDLSGWAKDYGDDYSGGSSSRGVEGRASDRGVGGSYRNRDGRSGRGRGGGSYSSSSSRSGRGRGGGSYSSSSSRSGRGRGGGSYSSSSRDGRGSRGGRDSSFRRDRDSGSETARGDREPRDQRGSEQQKATWTAIFNE